MADKDDGWSVAQARIAEEAVRRTGALDLSRLGLTRLPPELFHLRHLRRLDLGGGLLSTRYYEPEAVPNRIAGQLGSIGGSFRVPGSWEAEERLVVPKGV